MPTVIKRCFASTPARDAHATWTSIVDFLTKRKDCAARTELLAVSGPATSIIADRIPNDAPIIVTSDGPRTRIYCLYDGDAVEGSDTNEDAAGFDPLNGDWAVSLPCAKEELDWISAALTKHSTRITARDAATGIATEEARAATTALTLDVEGFLGS